jgi:hypothetical protein
MGTHDVFVADIVGISCDESLFGKEGKLHFERADLLAYAHGEYYSLGEVVGRFGFSTDKQKKAKDGEKNSKKPAPKTEKAEKPTKKSENDGKKSEKVPFYKSAPKGRSVKKKPTDKNKGAPHGKRGAKK